MKLVRRISLVAVCALLSGAFGCGGGNGKFAKVSGVVTLDGKPYPNAIVSFQPYGTDGAPNPGRGSSGLTDENGRYTLETDDKHTGAVVGKHRVRIRTKVNDWGNVVDPSIGSPDDTSPKGRKPEIEPIPSEWFSDDATKEFTVPPGGTDQANFEIVTKKRK